MFQSLLNEYLTKQIILYCVWITITFWKSAFLHWFWINNWNKHTAFIVYDSLPYMSVTVCATCICYSTIHDQFLLEERDMVFLTLRYIMWHIIFISVFFSMITVEHHTIQRWDCYRSYGNVFYNKVTCAVTRAVYWIFTVEIHLLLQLNSHMPRGKMIEW